MIALSSLVMANMSFAIGPAKKPASVNSDIQHACEERVGKLLEGADPAIVPFLNPTTLIKKCTAEGMAAAAGKPNPKSTLFVANDDHPDMQTALQTAEAAVGTKKTGRTITKTTVAAKSSSVKCPVCKPCNCKNATPTTTTADDPAGAAASNDDVAPPPAAPEETHQDAPAQDFDPYA